MEGGYSGVITGTFEPGTKRTKGNIGAKDYACTITDGKAIDCSYFDWVGTYFTGSFSYDSWGWIYSGGDNGIWVNADSGSSGDIMRTERVPEDVGSVAAQTRPPSCPTNLLDQGTCGEQCAVRPTEHPRPAQMTMSPQHFRQPACQGHVPKPPSFRRGNVPLPLVSLDAKLSLIEVHVRPR